MEKKRLLEGYYNYGNYGDDLLMIVTINFLKQMNIDFRMNEKDLHFFNEFICETRKGDEEIVIKGGGGLFFDFRKEGSIKDIFLNNVFSFSVFRKLGLLFLKDSRNIVLLGVGVGPYSNKSSRLWRHLLSFEKVKLFCLRDKESIDFVIGKGYKNVIQTTDLVFNHSLWSKYNSVKKLVVPPSPKKVGIVLRKWLYYDIDFNQIISKIIYNYGAENVIFYFLQDYDKLIIEKNYSYKSYTYEKGNEENLIKFTEALLEVDLIYTVRAHAAIVGASLNIPSVILPIEEKLINVHKMIPDVSYLNPDLYNYDFEKIDLWYSKLTISTFINRSKINQDLWTDKLEIIKNKLNE